MSRGSSPETSGSSGCNQRKGMCLIHLTWARLMPLLGKERKALESRARVNADIEQALRYYREDCIRLRKYIHGEMQRHFESYNGGLSAQIGMMAEYRLPTPWVPVGIRNIEDPIADTVTFNTITYVREQRMVPIREAGRI